MAFLDDVKQHLRISTDALDTEIQDLIDAAKADLELSGVDGDKIITDDVVEEGETTAEADPLIRRAITVYCKAHFGYDNPDHERLAKAYDMLKRHLPLADDYREADAE